MYDNDFKEKMLTVAFVIGILVLSLYTNYQLQKTNEDLVAEISVCKNKMDLFTRYLMNNDFEGYEELLNETNRNK